MTEDIKEVAHTTDQQTTAAQPSNDKAKRDKNRQANLAAMQLLLDAYPAIFNLESPRPLQVGIHEALATDGKLSKTKIRRALATYVRQSAYLHCLRTDAERIDLQGQPSGLVSNDESEHAKQHLVERQQKRQARLAKQGITSDRPARGKGRGPAAPRKAAADRPAAKAPTKPAASPQPARASEDEAPSADRMKEKLDRLLATLGGPKN